MERMTSRNEDCVLANGHALSCATAGEIVQMAERLAAYEDTGLEPEEVTALGKIFDYALKESKTLTEQLALLNHIRELAEADKDGRVVVLPCKVGERWVDEDGRAVRITAVIVSMEPFGENINIYFDYEDATPDDAGSDCVTNWDHFSRIFTCAETVLDNRKDADNA